MAPGKRTARRPAGGDDDAAIATTASKYWSPFTPNHEPFSEKLVEELYNTMLGNEGFVKRRVVLLEASQYLEAYLWPNFSPTSSSDTHVVSIVLMVNEKFRERIPAWDTFTTASKHFSAFFSRVCRIALDETPDKFTYAEQTAVLSFLVNAVNSVEVEVVRKEIVKLCSLAVLTNLYPSQRNAILSKSTKLLKYWNKLEAKFAELPEAEAAILDFNRRFVWGLINRFFNVLNFIDDEKTEPNPDAVHYVERFLEFAIDMVSLLTTRRFFNQLLIYSSLIVRATQSTLIETDVGALFCKLVTRLKFYVRFEIDDITGLALDEQSMVQRHYDHVVELQKAAFKFFRDRMSSFYLLSASAIDTPKVLSEQLSELDRDDLYSFAEYLHLVPTRKEKEAAGVSDDFYSKAFLKDAIVFHCERRPNQLQQLNEQPIFPSEKTIWDSDLVPYDQYDGDSVLALPKLNFQFLTLHDYLLRNFNLFQMESTYEIRGDIENTLYRVRPWKHEHTAGKVVWGGWARMALPLTEFRLVHVGRPLIGQRAPQEVTADISITLPNRKDLRQEWEGLHRHDVLFLVTVTPLLEVGGKFDHRKPFTDQIKVSAVRGCEVDGLINSEGKVVEEMEHRDALRGLTGDVRKYRVWMDPNQYFIDQTNEEGAIYESLNLVIRRDPKTNNFKAVLSTIRQLLNTDFVVPDWLQDLILGYGEPDSAHYSKLASPIAQIDFNDTFLSVEHLKSSFPGKTLTGIDNVANLKDPGFRLTFSDLVPQHDLSEDQRDTSIKVDAYERFSSAAAHISPATRTRRNKIPFTPAQIEAIKSGTEPGLTLVVGPPGTGKTDVAVQIISNIYHNWPEQRTLIVTHSNQALNQLFEKIIDLDVDERHILRLGHGEESLETEKDFSRYGRVNYVLSHRLELLKEVEALRDSLGETGDVGYSCETAGQFYRFVVHRLWNEFTDEVAAKQDSKDAVAKSFPFTSYFSAGRDANTPLFKKASFTEDLDIARACWKLLSDKFAQLEEFRAFELLRNGKDRTEYLLVKEAKVIAMTCTHAALRRKQLVDLGFRYDNILIEEAAQILEVETFVPLLLQDPHDGRNRLKRWIMIGDHHQLPPIVQNVTFQKYCNMEQSLFARFVRLGVPHILLDAQGRARPEIAALYNWRYRALHDLHHTASGQFALQNPGFAHNYQFIDVGTFYGQNETTPSPFFYQNLGEAEYAAALFIYMRVLGYPAEKISILTTYNGQVALIRDVVEQRCGNNPFIGRPHKISTVDRYQGQQNDYIILSLVRTEFVGHIRDVRRLVVALSRARLGLYVLGRFALFRTCSELAPALRLLSQKPKELQLLPSELYGAERIASDALPDPLVTIKDTAQMVQFSHKYYESNMGILKERYDAEHAKNVEMVEEEPVVAEEPVEPEVPKETPKVVGQTGEASEGAIVFESVEFERLEEMPKY
uniref:Intron-binding protein aquarius n=1 Tax=Panagrellus redivivus TaxID=6233 RepID=A0A7E4VRV5_PANRE